MHTILVLKTIAMDCYNRSSISTEKSKHTEANISVDVGTINFTNLPVSTCLKLGLSVEGLPLPSRNRTNGSLNSLGGGR